MQSAHPAPRASGWHDDLRLGYGPLDDVHEEFVTLVDALLAVSDNAMAAALTAVEHHCRAHFASEEQWMDETAFPARGCHTDEHAAVLASIEGVGRRVAAGDHAAGRRLARALADWFPGHADYLDSALAHWLCKKRLGGQPVLLRRSATTPAHTSP